MTYNKCMRDKHIVDEYKAGKHASYLASKYGISTRQVQRIVKKHGAIRTVSESYKLAIQQGRMTYHRIPEHLKKKRVRVSDTMRFYILKRDNYRCVVCGGTAREGLRLEVDHIDEDATNNEEYNLQTLCNRCNKGKHRNQ